MAVCGGGFGAVWEFASLDDLVRTQGSGFVPGDTWWRENVVLVGGGVEVDGFVGVYGLDRLSVLGGVCGGEAGSEG